MKKRKMKPSLVKKVLINGSTQYVSIPCNSWDVSNAMREPRYAKINVNNLQTVIQILLPPAFRIPVLQEDALLH